MKQTELNRHLRNNAYEQTADGILFPKANAIARGKYVHSVNGEDEQEDYNLLTIEGLNHALDTALKNGTQNTTWYLALYEGNYTPVNTLTAASFPATAGENTSQTEGYTGANRPTWTPGTIASGSVDNHDAKATFTFATASSVVINGAGLSSVQARGATTGVLLSATKFSAARTFLDTDTFTLGYELEITSS